MTPEQLAKGGSEQAHQTALFAYLAVATKYGFNVADDWCSGMGLEAAKSSRTNEQGIPALKWAHAIPNGGSRGDSKQSAIIRGGQLKAEGVKSGVADIFVPIPVDKWHGLYVEMKKPSIKPVRPGGKGGLSDEQEEFRDYSRSMGYGWAVCYGWREAVAVIKDYLSRA